MTDQPDSLLPFFLVAGPTACGKSELAADLAAQLDAEIINADAFQIYRGLPLLTAQPNESITGKAPHHLLALVSLCDEMNAAKFRALALRAMAEIRGRGKRIIVVGGSGLYLQVLTHGLATAAADPELRGTLNALSLEELNARLEQLDSLGAKNIDRKNKRRVVRALEILAAQTTTRQKEDIRESRISSFPPGNGRERTALPHGGVFVFRDRAELYQRIDRRVEEMFREGVVPEVASVDFVSGTAAKTLGLAQIRELIEDKITTAECVAAIQQATRRYAKRQLTWFRHQTNLEPLNLSRLNDYQAAIYSLRRSAERVFSSAE